MEDASREETFLKEARRFTRISALPGIYEEALYKAGKSLGDRTAWNGKNPSANEIARNKMLEKTPPELRETTSVLQHDNTTSVIIYDPEKHEVTVTFDSTSQIDNVLVNNDEWDAFVRQPTEHTLGGQVHTGLYRDLVDKDPNGSDLVDKISGILHEHAYNHEEPLTVNFVGFSRGGALTALTAGEMMGRNLFENNNIALGSIISYGSPAYASPEYIENFNRKAQELGAKNNWAIELRGDNIPVVLTPEHSNFFARYMYGQVGERVYLDDDIIFSPEKDELARLRNQPATDSHYIDCYDNKLSSYKIEQNAVLNNEANFSFPVDSLSR